MEKFPKRKRLRAPSYDYTNPGYYFITICIHKKANLLGYIEDGEFKSYNNCPDRIIEEELFDLEKEYSHVKIDEYIIMPNHIHFILIVEGKTNIPISDLVSDFKRKVNYRYRLGVKENKFSPYKGKFWQKSFYDRVIRNDRELYETRKYILENPIKWELDEMYNEEEI